MSDEGVAPLVYGLLGRRHARRVQQGVEELKRRHAVECMLRDPSDQFHPYLSRWRLGQANLKAGLISFEPYGRAWSLFRSRRRPRIPILVRAVAPEPRKPWGLERLYIGGQIYTIETAHNTLEWSLLPAVADWAIGRVNPDTTTSSDRDVALAELTVWIRQQTPDRSAESLAEEMIAAGQSPVATIGALARGRDLSFGEAKQIVHPRLPEAVRDQAEQLWDLALVALDDDLVSEAIVVWSGKPEYPSPRPSEQRVRERFPDAAPEPLLEIVRYLVEEFYRSDARHRAADLAEMADMATRDFQELHPTQSKAAVNALAWCYTFDFK